jgi:hypothetical protein
MRIFCEEFSCQKRTEQVDWSLTSDAQIRACSFMRVVQWMCIPTVTIENQVRFAASKESQSQELLALSVINIQDLISPFEFLHPQISSPNLLNPI